MNATRSTTRNESVSRLFQAIRREDFPVANKQFLKVMSEKMRRAIRAQYQEAAQEFGQRFTQDSTSE